MRKIYTCIFFLVFILPICLVAQKSVLIDLKESPSVTPNLGLSGDTVVFNLTIKNALQKNLFFRSSSFDFLSVSDDLGRLLLTNESYQNGIQQINLEDSISARRLEVKIFSREQILVPMIVTDTDLISAEIEIKDAFYLFFAGIFVSIILYNLFLFVCNFAKNNDLQKSGYSINILIVHLLKNFPIKHQYLVCFPNH